VSPLLVSPAPGRGGGAVDGEKGGHGGVDPGGDRGVVRWVLAKRSAELLVADDAAQELLGGDLEVVDGEPAGADPATC